VADPVLRTARFADLTPQELYGLVRLRVDVFVVEQNCPYPELDGRDTEPGTVHVWHELDGEVVACIRVLDQGADRSIGRVATARHARGRGLSARLMNARHRAVRRTGHRHRRAGVPRGLVRALRLRAQRADYVEDGIPHLPMRRPAD
jgi:ElaA protein